MVDVNDQVADLQIAQVRQERFGNRAPRASLRALFLEDVRLGNDVKLCRRKAEAFGELTDGDEDRHVQQLVGAVHHHAAKVVLGEQLHRALGAPFGAGDKHDGVAALAHAAHFRDPFLDSASEFDGRLTRDV